MAGQLYRSERVLANVLDACAESLVPHLGLDLRDLVYAAGDESAAQRLDQTELAQPALFMVSYALVRWWQSLGVAPAMLIGHSVGEFAAAALAGVMSMQDAARLVALRGKLMQALPAGSMLAVQLPEVQLRQRLPATLEIAAVNGPAFCVVSGPMDAVDSFATALELGQVGDEIACRRLRTSHAFHSHMMDPAIEPFKCEVRGIELHPPKIPMIATVTAKMLDASTVTDPVYWARQIRQPVAFFGALSNILKDLFGDLVFLEVGPNMALSTLARQHPLDALRHHIVSTLPHAKQSAIDAKFVFMSLGRLWQHGVRIDWQGLYRDEQRRRVHLPGYRFERQRYSFESECVLDQPAHQRSQQVPPVGPGQPSNAIGLTAAKPADSAVLETDNGSPTPPQKEIEASFAGNLARLVIQQQLELMSQQMTILQNAKNSQSTAPES